MLRRLTRIEILLVIMIVLLLLLLLLPEVIR